MDGDKIFIPKGIKILIGLFILYLVIMLIIFLPGYLKKQKENIYILTNTYKIKYKKGKWNNIVDSEDYKLEEFSVYENNAYKGDYTIIPGNKLNLYKSGKNVSYTGNIVAYRGSLKFKLLEADIVYEMNDLDKLPVKKALSNAKLTENYDFSFFQKATLDIDEDGEEESVYCLNNFSVDNSKDYYSLLFIYDDNEVKIIDKEITDINGIDDKPIYAISNIVDIREDDSIELLYTLNYNNGSRDSECVKLYNLNKKKEVHNFCE